MLNYPELVEKLNVDDADFVNYSSSVTQRKRSLQQLPINRAQNDDKN